MHGLYKTAFSARYQHVFSFLHPGHHFLEFSVKCTSLYITVVFSPRSERFVLFALGSPLLSHFQQSSQVCTKQRFKFSAEMTKRADLVFRLRSARFVIFALGKPPFSHFSAKCTSLCKTAFSARDQQVLSFSHWAHGFVPESVFSPRSECFAIFALCAPLFSDFQQSARVCAN